MSVENARPNRRARVRCNRQLGRSIRRPGIQDLDGANLLTNLRYTLDLTDNQVEGIETMDGRINGDAITGNQEDRSVRTEGQGDAVLPGKSRPLRADEDACEVEHNGQGGARTLTGVTSHRILNPVRLPIPPLGRECPTIEYRLRRPHTIPNWIRHV